MSTPQLYACLRYADAPAALTFLTRLGFVERLVHRDAGDPDVIHHAQLQWRDIGGIMLGSDREDGIGSRPGAACIDLVVESDAEVVATLERALTAGARQLGEVHRPPHGGCTVAIADPEGNVWTIDSYPGV